MRRMSSPPRAPVNPQGTAGQTVEQKKARAALMANLVVLPGLGTIACKLWVEGIAQLALVAVGAVLLCVWLYGFIGAMFSSMGLPLDGGPSAREGLIGLGLSVLAWAWSGWTGYRLWRGAQVPPK
jgi:hypothetical protein